MLDRYTTGPLIELAYSRRSRADLSILPTSGCARRAATVELQSLSRHLGETRPPGRHTPQLAQLAHVHIHDAPALAANDVLMTVNVAIVARRTGGLGRLLDQSCKMEEAEKL